MTRAGINTYTLGPWETNCYVISYPPNPACWIIDAGFEPGELIEGVRAARLTPGAIILTHAHVDHIAGVDEVRRAFPGTPVWVHEAEREWLSDATLNLSAFTGVPVTCHGPGRELKHGDELELGGHAWRVLHTPGHSPGGITLYSADDATTLVGDALFAGSVGRTDFPGCSMEELARSIRTRLYTLDPRTRVLPGHGPETTIDRERRSNPFVRP